MSTRCLICRENRKGIVRGIYCHHDGYPDGVGAMLLRCYWSTKMIDRLIRRGDLLSLGPTPTRGTHPFDADACSTFAGESASFVGRASTVIADSHRGGVEWVYLWRRGAWLVAENVWEHGLSDFELLANRLPKNGEGEFAVESRRNEAKLSIELSLVLVYLYRCTKLSWPFGRTKYHRELFRQFHEAGYMKNGQLTESGLDEAWHLIEKYRMDYGLEPQESLVVKPCSF